MPRLFSRHSFLSLSRIYLLYRTALFSLCPSSFSFSLSLFYFPPLYFVLLALISTLVPSVLAFVPISILSSRFDASIQLILYHFAISFFFYRVVLASFSLADFFLKKLSFFSLLSSFPYPRIGVGFTFALLPSIFLTSSPSCCVYTFLPGNFSSSTTLATFSLTQFGLSLVLPHRCSSMFFLC